MLSRFQPLAVEANWTVEWFVSQSFPYLPIGNHESHLELLWLGLSYLLVLHDLSDNSGTTLESRRLLNVEASTYCHLADPKKLSVCENTCNL